MSSNISYEDIEEPKIRKISTLSTSTILIISLIVMLIAYIVKPVNNNIQDNVVIVITMISAIISLILLFADYLGIKNLYSKTFFNVAKELENKLHTRIKNITNKEDK